MNARAMMHKISSSLAWVMAILTCLCSSSCSDKRDTLFLQCFSKEYDTAHSAIAEYLKAGFDLNRHEPVLGNTILHQCAAKGWGFDIETLLKSGADSNAVNGLGETPLMLASRAKYFIGSVRLLLAAGAKMDFLDNDGKSAVHHALGNADVLMIILKKGGAVDGRTKGGRTPLIQASFNGCYGAMQILIHAGATINAQDFSGDTPLMGALNACDEFGVDLLLDAGVNVALTNKSGFSAITIAEQKGCTNVATKLRLQQKKLVY